MATGVTTRTALQTIADELDTTRRHLHHAITRQAKLEQRIRDLETSLRKQKERTEAWKTVAQRERSKRPRGKAFA